MSSLEFIITAVLACILYTYNGA